MSELAGRVDQARLWRRHLELAEIGRTANGGVTRLAFSNEDVMVRARLLEWCAGSGRRISMDELGNLFIARPGRVGAPSIMTGSHLDTQPNGGNFDGTFGVLAGLEVLDALDDARIMTQQPIVVAVWGNEEGVRFAPTTMGSGGYTGALDPADVLRQVDGDGITVAEAVDEMRLALSSLGSACREPVPQTYVEAHIEQGPTLERDDVTIGVVTGIQAIAWLQIRISGAAAHAGTTPRSLRRDAMTGAARIIAALDRVAAADEHLRLTVGRLDVVPNSTNTVASQVTFTVDVRHPDDARLDEVLADVIARVQEFSSPCGYAVTQLLRSDAVVFDEAVVACIETEAIALGLSTERLVSGATHDARHLAAVAPSGMLFVPSAGGVSHHPAERSSAEDLAAGARVLAQALLQLSS